MLSNNFSFGGGSNSNNNPNEQKSMSLIKPNQNSGSKKSQLNEKQLAEVLSQDYTDDEPIDAIEFAKTESAKSIDLDKVINIKLTLQKKYVKSSSFAEQSMPFLVSLKSDSLKNISKTPIDLVCVIDHSGSMSGKKIEYVRNTFNYLMEYLDDKDRLSIVIFDDKAMRLTPLIRMTEKNKKKTMSAVKSIQGQGGTDINYGMMHAFHVLNSRKYQNTVSSIFLLSDGLDEGAQGRIKSSIGYFNIPQVYTVHTFGYGSDHDPKLMADIADLKDGNFYFIDDLETVDETFIDCLGGLISSIAQSVEIRIKAVSSDIMKPVRIVKAYGDQQMWQKDGDEYITTIAQLISGKQKDYILELRLPTQKKELLDHEKNVVLASAQATIVGLDDKTIKKTSDLEVMILNEIEDLYDNEDDREVMKHFYRLKGGEVLENARYLADAKNYKEAENVLKAMKEELSNCVIKDEDFIKNLLKDIEMAQKDIKPEVYEFSGKHHMIENARANIQQRSNLTSNNKYSNSIQQEMLFAHKIKKSK